MARPGPRLLHVSSVAALGGLLVSSCLSGAARRPPPVDDHGVTGIRWTVLVDETLDEAHVEVCVEGGPPQRLVASTDPAARWARDVVDGEGAALPEAAGGWRWPAGAPCARYGVALGWASLLEQNPDRAVELGDDVIVAPDLLLLRPGPEGADVERRVRFELPHGISVSAPFPPGAGGWRAVPSSTFLRKGYVVFGSFVEERLPVAGGLLRVTPLAGAGRLPAGVRHRFLYEAGRAAASLYGELPVSDVQVLLVGPGVPLPGGPVFFGLTTRGGGAAISLFVDSFADDEELIGEWVAVHELAHLGLPWMREGERWLSEGLATYYQNVLRGRTGLLDERETWKSIAGGLRRARAEARSSYVWLYGSGAAIALRVDVDLRRRPAPRCASLDEALAAYRARYPLDDDVGAAEVTARLDERCGDERFAEGADRWRRGEAFAGVDELLDRLGVSGRGEDVVLRSDAPDASLREDVLQGWRRGRE